MIKLNSINQKACLINWNHETYNIKPLFTFTYLAEATYSAFRLYIFYQYVCSLGIEPITFCAANAMLYHWATGPLKSLTFKVTFLRPYEMFYFFLKFIF